MSQPAADAYAHLELLLLDDDPGILRLQQRRLEAAGHRVVPVLTPAEALDHLRRRTFAMVLFDYRLADGVTGLDFYRQLRQEGFDLPAVMVTAFSDERRVIEALRAGVRDVIPKSGEYLDYLPQAVDRVMAQIAAERQVMETEALRESEERLRALNAELERREQQLRQQAAQLAEANRVKDEFLAILAHELRNPLAPLRFAVALLEDLPPEQARAREIIDRQVTHLVRLVDDLLDVSRITRNKIQLRMERVRLRAIMQAAVESVLPLVQAAGLTLTTPDRVPDAWLEADPARLTQVFTNLLNNAAKYTSAPGTIAFSVRRDEGTVRVSVKDSGMGIAPEQLDRVFEMFHQATDSQQHTVGGLGIGLTLARRLVFMHGGTITASSAGRGQGAEFVVTLPLVGAPEEVTAAPPEPVSSAPPIAAGRLKVLIVDDNIDSAELLSLVVSHAGHEVRAAHDGPGGLAAFREFQPDVALLDIGLPGADGYQLAKAFREAAGDRVLLVAITGWGQDEDRRRAREAGFDRHLVKPADPGTIESLLAERARGG